MAKTTPPVRVRPPAPPASRAPARQPGANQPARAQTGSARAATTSIGGTKPRGTARRLPPATVPKGSSGGRPGAAGNRTAHRGGKAGAPEGTRRGIKVQATQVGYYAHERKRPGDVFIIRGEEDFSDKWMERVDRATPIATTTPNQAIARRHDEILEQKAADAGHGTTGPARGTGDRSVLEGDEGDEGEGEAFDE